MESSEDDYIFIISDSTNVNNFVIQIHIEKLHFNFEIDSSGGISAI